MPLWAAGGHRYRGSPMIARILTFPAHRIGKWVTLVAWLAIAFASFPLVGKFESAQNNEPSSFLPGSAESVRALEQAKRFPSGDTAPAVVVYRREGGLTEADKAAIAQDRAAIEAYREKTVTSPSDLGPRPAGPPVLSPDGSGAILVVPIEAGGESDVLRDTVKQIRDTVGEGADGLQVAVTGPAGYSADAIEVFGGIDTKLLLATAVLVLVLLLIIYRSPIFWIFPLLAVGFAELTTRALGYLAADAGLSVNGQTAGILTVLVFGAGTDYALLLVARYREELRRHQDRHEAMALAMRRAGPAITASAATNVIALLVLVLAEVNGTAGLGPIGAMGIAVAMISVMTALPALLVIVGRWAFWPFVPAYGSEVTEGRGFWRRAGERVVKHPRRVWVGTSAVLLVFALGLLNLNTNLTSANDFRSDVEAVRGQQILNQSFPSGASAPSTVIVGDPSKVAAVRAALEKAPGVAAVGPVETGPAGARFPVTLTLDPYSKGAYDAVPGLREVIKAAGGETALLGGSTAEEADFRVSASRDDKVLIPIVLLVVFLILALLLRAVIAPLVLIATVALSYAAALGASVLIFDWIFGFPGESPTLVLFGFIFLVALGVDYNIFLMARVREEAVRHGTREGMLHGLAVTGSVITAAGVVLAGTFLVLGVLPLVTLTQIGFLVAFGVLVDTFIVRSVLVPALVFDIGPKIWWPSRLARAEGDAAGPSAPPSVPPHVTEGAR